MLLWRNETLVTCIHDWSHNCGGDPLPVSLRVRFAIPQRFPREMQGMQPGHNRGED